MKNKLSCYPWNYWLFDERFRIRTKDKREIAAMHWDSEIPREELEPDFILMASAPELLDSLEALLDIMHYSKMESTLITKANELLARIKDQMKEGINDTPLSEEDETCPDCGEFFCTCISDGMRTEEAVKED